jgi:hypothetical protein
MLEIRYRAPNDLDISASVEELLSVRLRIFQLVQSNIRQISITANTAIDPAPYQQALSKLVIVQRHCPVRVSLQNEKEILVEGSSDCLETFASFFEFRSDAEQGSHTHFEYYQGNDRIAPDSIPLVIGVK